MSRLPSSMVTLWRKSTLSHLRAVLLLVKNTWCVGCTKALYGIKQAPRAWHQKRSGSSTCSSTAMDGHTAQRIPENVLKHAKDDITTIMRMGHNRGWEEAASELCGIAVELRTANAALLEAPGVSWKEAFEKAGMGGWKLVGIMKPDSMSDVEYEAA